MFAHDGIGGSQLIFTAAVDNGCFLSLPVIPESQAGRHPSARNLVRTEGDDLFRTFDAGIYKYIRYPAAGQFPAIGERFILKSRAYDNPIHRF